MKPGIQSTTLLLLAATIVAGCAPATRAATDTPVVPTVNSPPGPAAVAQARADSIRHPYTAADVNFMSSMIGHHAQAIVMARMAPTHGASASVRTLADRIINAQQDEIATMQRWLRDRLQPVPEARPGPMRMNMNGMEHEMLMPGMLTDQQMAQLGAVSMVQQLFGSWGAGQDETVFKFASDVNVDQTTEIARMQQMLASVVFQIPAP